MGAAPSPPCAGQLMAEETSRASSQRFEALDGLRGVAAAAVLLFHAGFVVHREIARSGYLGVDLFFSLSGFVIAHSYGARLQGGLGGWAFLKLRLIRLYPVYFIGTAIAAAFLIPQALYAPQAHSLARLCLSLLSALLFLPAPPAFSVDPRWLFPVNIPAWSLFCELLAGMAYVAFARAPSTSRLLWVVASSGVLLLAAMAVFGNIEIGPQWIDLSGGVPRTLFAFFCGVLAYHVRQRHREAPGPARVPPTFWLVLLATLFAVTPRHVIGVELGCAFVGFPLLVYLASCTPSAPAEAAIFQWAGRVSYPAYAIQAPVLMIAELVERRSHLLTRHWAIAVVVLFVLVIALAALIERYCDLPARRWIRRHGARPALREMQAPAAKLKSV